MSDASPLRLFFRKYARFQGYATRPEFWWPYLLLVLIHVVIFGATTAIVTTAFAEDVTTDAAAGNMEASYQIWFEGGAAVIVGIGGLLHFVVFAATISPLLAVTWRRFHDTGRPGPMFFLWLIPLVGWIIVLVLLAMPSRPHARRPEWDDPQEAQEMRPAGA